MNILINQNKLLFFDKQSILQVTYIVLLINGIAVSLHGMNRSGILSQDIAENKKKNEHELFVAICKANHPEVRQFVHNGVNINSRAWNRDATPLVVAASLGAIDCIRTLLIAGADVNLGDKHGCTPLMVATCLGCDQIVKILVAGGADVNCQHKTGVTPLMVAAAAQNKPILTLLFISGANLDVQDNQGRTALIHAVMHAARKSVKRLLFEGARDDLQDKYTNSAWDYSWGKIRGYLENRKT